MKHGQLVHHVRRLIYADDATEDVSLLFRMRIPWLITGLALGVGITFVVSRFEGVLVEQVSLAFFIPVIVYMSDAVGNQTATIYIRNLSRKPTKLSVYFIKELTLGLLIGALSGTLLALFSLAWLNNTSLALTVGLAMALSIMSASIIALIMPTLMQKFFRVDPAVGAGPFTTAIQDFVSLLIYFLIASAVILS